MELSLKLLILYIKLKAGILLVREFVPVKLVFRKFLLKLSCLLMILK